MPFKRVTGYGYPWHEDQENGGFYEMPLGSIQWFDEKGDGGDASAAHKDADTVGSDYNSWIISDSTYTDGFAPGWEGDRLLKMDVEHTDSHTGG